MKVAFHIDQLWFGAPGGIGTYVRNLVPALEREDPALDLTLFRSRFEGQPEPEEAWLRRFPVVEVPGTIRSLYPRWALTARPPLPPELAAADIVHASNPAAVPPAGPGQKLVVTVHDLAFLHEPGAFSRQWRLLYRAGLRATVKRADAIITPSRNTAEDVLTRTKVDPRKLYVVPLAAALPSGGSEVTAVMDRLKIRHPFILFVGTLEPRKNLVRLIRAYRRVAANGLPQALVLAGPMGWRVSALQREISLRGPGEILLTGPLTAGDLDALYRACEIFVYPSLYEGFGLPVVEAMVRGVPVIASNTSSVPEVAGDAAIGVNPRSIREIALAIETLLTDRDLRDAVARRGLLQSGRFTWEETARQTLEVYERVMGTKSS